MIFSRCRGRGGKHSSPAAARERRGGIAALHPGYQYRKIKKSNRRWTQIHADGREERSELRRQQALCDEVAYQFFLSASIYVHLRVNFLQVDG
jgi:hypothetical protein